MSRIDKIAKADIDKALVDNDRQYLVGNLKLPQQLQHIRDDNVEVGISYYKEFTSDSPHLHNKVTEYQMILSGSSFIKDLGTNEVISLNEGDFYIVHKGTPYAQKSAAGTKILFFKHPAVNDKVPVKIDETNKKWLEEEM